jgi:hypothetical protein
MMPNSDRPGEVEMLMDAKKMHAAVLDEEVMEPDAATKNQLEILLMMRRMMMEHKRCPTCHRSVSDTPEPQPYKEDKAMGADAGSKKMVEMVAGDKTMAVDAGSNKKKNKRPMEEGKNKKNKRSKKEGKNKNKRLMEELRGWEKWKMAASEGEAMVVDLGSREDSDEYSMGRTGKRRTKMVTCRLSKEFVQEYIRTHPRVRPFAHSTSSHIQRLFAHHIAEYEVKCELHASWQSQCDIKGYVEYQEEVTNDEDA